MDPETKEMLKLWWVEERWRLLELRMSLSVVLLVNVCGGLGFLIAYAGVRFFWIMFYFFIILVLVLLLFLLRANFEDFRRGKRRVLGRCVECGYRLDNLTQPRCPECGTAFEPRPASSP